MHYCRLNASANVLSDYLSIVRHSTASKVHDTDTNPLRQALAETLELNNHMRLHLKAYISHDGLVLCALLTDIVCWHSAAKRNAAQRKKESSCKAAGGMQGVSNFLTLQEGLVK